MSKTIAGVALVALGGSAVAGTAIMLPKWLNGVDADLPEDLSTFKDGRQREGCIKSLFGEMAKLADETNNAISSADVSNAPNPFLGEAKKTQSCLVVNWDKKSKSENSSTKWNGTFRLLWAVRGETKGFYAFLLGKSTKESAGTNHKLAWEAAAYILENKDVDGTKKWTEIKHTAAKSNSSFVGTEANLNKLPIPGSALKGSDNSTAIPTFWGFFGAANELNSVDEVGKPDGDGVQNASLKAYWKWAPKGVAEASDSASSSSVQLLDWTNNFEAWWKEVFDDTKFKIKDVLANQQGSWEQKQYLTV